MSDIDKKINVEDHAEYITTQQYNNLTSDNFVSRLTQASLPCGTDVANFVNKKDFNFTKQYFEKANEKQFRTEKVIKKIGDKLYLKWNWCNSTFISWIDKKDLI